MLKSSIEEINVNSLMASDFSTAGSLPPRFIAAPFTNPFEERDGIAWRNELLAFTGLIQHGQWGEVGRLRSKLRHPYSSGRSVAAPSATSIDALRGITLASVGRIQAPWIGRQGVVEGAGLMGIRRQFRVRNLSSCGTWREFWRICFSFVFDEGGCKIGWVAKWILIVTGEWVALPNRNNCPSFRSRTKILGKRLNFELTPAPRKNRCCR